MRRFPALVDKMQVFDGWVVGSAADPSKDLTKSRDFDVCVPFGQWHLVAPLLTSQQRVLISPTTFGGWKVRYEDEIFGKVTVDVWPDEVGRLLASGHCKFAFHLFTKTQLVKQ